MADPKKYDYLKKQLKAGDYKVYSIMLSVSRSVMTRGRKSSILRDIRRTKSPRLHYDKYNFYCLNRVIGLSESGD